jgi:hypothetical protein
MFSDRKYGDNALLDALEAAQVAEWEAQFERPIPDVSGIEPNSVAPARRVGRGGASRAGLAGSVDRRADREPVRPRGRITGVTFRPSSGDGRL